MRRALLVSMILVGCGGPSSPTPPPPVANTPPAEPTEAPTSSDCKTSDECVAVAKKLLQAPVVAAKDPAAATEANKRALDLFRAACEAQHPEACAMVGTMLQDDQYYGLTKDDASAAAAYDRACHLANAHACYRLGVAYWEGLLDHVVENGQARSFKWPNDRQLGAALLRHACDDFKQPDACKLLVELDRAGAL